MAKQLTPAEDGIRAAQEDANVKERVLRALVEQLAEQVVEDKDMLGMVMDRAGLDPDDDASYEIVNDAAYEFFRVAKLFLKRGAK